MDKFGIDAAVVIAHAWARWRSSSTGTEHDVIAAEIKKFPDRLIGVSGPTRTWDRPPSTSCAAASRTSGTSA